ncbi:indole-3-glycerol phosphate synthase [Thermosyntropha lipolytica DSM 11003]|uniref:indole-3-glycerol-phosphate synthase n=1 Tax=Thermosyntropha lipolytica DSM 11003 TaxID=1123382 RepID=A0A1M5M4H4_9FIRM|nr:indole-3-glycerol phosphate synthase TrpC [Thermosyntropha lipolytica]SHG72222.1 indole-3-glycerol phosphate synthase [Thermosyntropha lipolytica DSM 11003]
MLEKIIEEKKRELEKLLPWYERGEYQIEKKDRNRRERLNPTSFLQHPSGKVQVIAEIKKASPAKGDLNRDLDPVKTALVYEKNGAAAVSVLTEEVFFKGDRSLIPEIKSRISIPVLRKDFIIHEVQLYETAVLGADMVLLIGAVLGYEKLLSLTEKALDLGLEPVVEVYSREEARWLKDLPARLVAVNNRDLKTFKVDIGNSIKLADFLPPSTIRISASGIKGREDVRRLAACGYHAVLVGERLVTSPCPGEKLRELLT